MYKVTFVCTANMCRSPLAEAIFRKKITEGRSADILETDSCGVWAVDGQPPSSNSMQVAKENGLDISQYRSRHIDLNLIKSSDLLLCMEPAHKQDLLQIFPHFKSKIFTLIEFARQSNAEKLQIEDPIGRSMHFYRKVYKNIEDEIERVFPPVRRKANATRMK